MATSSFSKGTVVLPKNHLPSCNTANTAPPPTRIPSPLAVSDAVAFLNSFEKPCSEGNAAETKNPTATPPSVISSGIMKCSKSINVAAISPAKTRLHVIANRIPGVDCSPKHSQQVTKATPVKSSTQI